MTRHSKNCTASSVYSYHEKQKDGKASGFGSLEQRFSKDAVKDFDCCSLSLHPCRNPVITPDGYLYDKEAILEYIVTKRVEIAKKLKEYKKQCKREKDAQKEVEASEEKRRVEKFLKTESGVGVPSKISVPGPSTLENNSVTKLHARSASVVSNMGEGKEKLLPSFWIPALTPENKESKIIMPAKTILCPMSNKSIKMKDLIPVKFTFAKDQDDVGSLEAKRERYKCPVTGDILGNHVPCAILRTTGDVVTMQCVEMIRRDMQHPLTGETLQQSDIIPLQRGGTGYSGVNDNLVAKKARPVMQA